MDKHPEIVTHVGDRTRHVRDTLVALIAGPDNLAEQTAVRKQVMVLEAEVAGPTPNVLERLLAQRIGLAWLHHTLLENSIALIMEKAAINPEMESAERCIDYHQKWLNHEIIANVVYGDLGGVLLNSNAIFELHPAHDCRHLLGTV